MKRREGLSWYLVPTKPQNYKSERSGCICSSNNLPILVEWNSHESCRVSAPICRGLWKQSDRCWSGAQETRDVCCSWVVISFVNGHHHKNQVRQTCQPGSYESVQKNELNFKKGRGLIAASLAMRPHLLAGGGGGGGGAGWVGPES